MKNHNPYGAKRRLDGEWQELGTYYERFESAPPDGAIVSPTATRARHAVDQALNQTTARSYGGHRHYGAPWKPVRERVARAA